MNASITASKKELGYQLQYPGKNKEYVNIRNFYSWGDKKDTVDTLTRNSYISPTIYDLRTPMKKGNQKKQTMKKLSCRLINLQISKATKKERPKDGLLYFSATSLSDPTPDDFPTRVKSSVTDELHCYNNASNNFGHQSISSNIDYRQKKYPHTTEWLMENTMCSST